MAELIYTGDVEDKDLPKAPVPVRTDLKADLDNPSGYRTHPHVVKAVNAALWLGQPLLVTGAPGVGKSSIAAAVARELALGDVKTIHCRAEMSSADLFYSFDHLRRLFDVNTSKAGAPLPPMKSYIDFLPLGEAILQAAKPDAPLARTSTRSAKGLTAAKLAPKGLLENASPQSVVLIDEIDKAPRDVPNDILNEIADMKFRIPELGVEVEALPERRPIVIMTSNSEKALPDAFLRRCVYVHVPYPDLNPDGESPTMEEIVRARLGDMVDSRLFRDAFELFRRIHMQSGTAEVKPSPAVFLNWLLVLRHIADGDVSKGLAELGDAADFVGVMAQGTERLERARKAASTWQEGKN